VKGSVPAPALAAIRTGAGSRAGTASLSAPSPNSAHQTVTVKTAASGGVPPVPCTTDMRLTGMIEIDGPVAANLNDALMTLIAFEFFDGVGTIASSMPQASGSVRLTTDATGRLSGGGLSFSPPTVSTSAPPLRPQRRACVMSASPTCSATARQRRNAS
jgi:hypothetical protein